MMIDVEAGGQPYQGMHVDWGTMAQVFLYPPSINRGDEGKGTHGGTREAALHHPQQSA